MRWPDVIPPSSPDPIKPAAGASNSMPLPVRRALSPLLFGAEDGAEASGENAREKAMVDDDINLDVDFDEHDDDWIIDDLGEGMKDVPEKDHATFGAREMGKQISTIFFGPR